jgi:hypothetical protein
MSDIYIPNRTEMPNFVINQEQPNMVKSVIIENPRLELEILRQIAALDGDSSGIRLEDFGANPQKAEELLKRLQGIGLYWNDASPWYESAITFYDLETARQFLETIQKDLGEVAFRNSKVVFEELLLGIDFRNLPQFKGFHFPSGKSANTRHIITKAYSVPRSGSVAVNPSLRSLSQNTKEILLDLQLYSDSNVLLSWVVEHPDRELRLLREIAGADGNADSVSDTDMRSGAFQAKLRQLEGYRLYTNDPREDATQADLNSAYALLQAMNNNFNLAQTNVLLSENILPASDRRVIQGGQIILNEQTGNYVEVTNFAK